MPAPAQPSPIASRPRSLVVAAVAYTALFGIMLLVDGPVSAWAQALPAWLVGAFAAITTLGLSDLYLWPAGALWLLCFALAQVAPRRVPRLALLQMAGLYAFLFCSVGLPFAVSWLAKRLIGRARPERLDSVGSFQLSGWSLDWAHQSLPSGHTVVAFAAAIAVGYLWPRWRIASLFLAVLVGLSRIVLGAHYPTDVLAGALLGAVGAMLVYKAFVRLGWVFRRTADGRVRPRPLSAVDRLVRGARALPKQ